jgi:hypothetical protein
VPSRRILTGKENVDYVRCRICGDRRRVISGRHLSKHRAGCLLHGSRKSVTSHNDNVGFLSDCVRSEIRPPFWLTLRVAIVNKDILPLYVSKLVQTLPKGFDSVFAGRRRATS